ncbi:hypothetical protein C5S29_00945, partial [ANME-1 cluster archaeon GoMg3.2]|nr:hypothetical protein [ANME-1 cluster archaeon GoMg3.2]
GMMSGRKICEWWDEGEFTYKGDWI